MVALKQFAIYSPWEYDRKAKLCTNICEARAGSIASRETGFVLILATGTSVTCSKIPAATKQRE